MNQTYRERGIQTVVAEFDVRDDFLSEMRVRVLDGYVACSGDFVQPLESGWERREVERLILESYYYAEESPPEETDPRFEEWVESEGDVFTWIGPRGDSTSV